MQTYAVEIDNLSFNYPSVQALVDVSLQIKTGDFACIVGPNGGGKTTLLKLMLGLLTPTKGKIKMLGQSPIAARKKIGYVPQQTQIDSSFPATVLDVVKTGCLGSSCDRWFGFFGKAHRARAMHALTQVNIQNLADRHIAELSGGQFKRVLIARALASEPEILLLDEPTASLDAKVGADFHKLLGILNQKLTIIMVSHDISFASSDVKSVVCVNKHVKIHPTSEMTVEKINELLGHSIRLVDHSHNCLEKGCSEGDHA